MSETLDKTARRIIGVLIEKQLSTPNLYPLTQNALTNGCNQKSNRNPVLVLQEFEIEGALRNLYVHEWVTNVTGAGSRVLKWKHRGDEKLNLNEHELAIMGELLLRGAQTGGELRSRVARMRKFSCLDDLIETLDQMREKGLVTLSSPIPGRRAQLYDHTLYLEGEKTYPDSEDDKPQPTIRHEVDSVPDVDALSRIEQQMNQLRIRLERIETELGLEAKELNSDDL